MILLVVRQRTNAHSGCATNYCLIWASCRAPTPDCSRYPCQQPNPRLTISGVGRKKLQGIDIRFRPRWGGLRDVRFRRPSYASDLGCNSVRSRSCRRSDSERQRCKLVDPFQCCQAHPWSWSDNPEHRSYQYCCHRLVRYRRRPWCSCQCRASGATCPHRTQPCVHG